MKTSVTQVRPISVSFEKSRVIGRETVALKDDSQFLYWRRARFPTTRSVSGTIPGQDQDLSELDIKIARHEPRFADAGYGISTIATRQPRVSYHGQTDVLETRLGAQDVDPARSSVRGSTVHLQFLAGRPLQSLTADTVTGKVHLQPAEQSPLKRAVANLFGRNDTQGVVHWSE